MPAEIIDVYDENNNLAQANKIKGANDGEGVWSRIAVKNDVFLPIFMIMLIKT